MCCALQSIIEVSSYRILVEQFFTHVDVFLSRMGCLGRLIISLEAWLSCPSVQVHVGAPRYWLSSHGEQLH